MSYFLQLYLVHVTFDSGEDDFHIEYSVVLHGRQVN